MVRNRKITVLFVFCESQSNSYNNIFNFTVYFVSILKVLTLCNNK